MPRCYVTKSNMVRMFLTWLLLTTSSMLRRSSSFSLGIRRNLNYNWLPSVNTFQSSTCKLQVPKISIHLRQQSRIKIKCLIQPITFNDICSNSRVSSLFSFPPSSSTYSSSYSSTCEPSSSKVKLSTDVLMEVLLCRPQNSVACNDHVLLFLHGSFHGGWCWMEYWGPYFASKGFTVIAPSWRGTGGTCAGNGVKKVKIAEHVADLNSLIEQIPHILSINQSNSTKQTLPTIISHSFGGIVVMKFLEQLHEEKKSINNVFSGIVTMCSVPPSGNGPMTLRYLKRSLQDSYKITVGFAMKRCLSNTKLCRELFFDNSVSDSTIARYQRYFARDSEATIDLLDLAKQLPSKQTNEQGVADFVTDSSSLPPIAVMGASHDFIVDSIGVHETATFFGNVETIFFDSPHDIMLGSNWENGAGALYQWIKHKVMLSRD
jgi:pimeloyl-ACP methyl ester carboxylesterase